MHYLDCSDGFTYGYTYVKTLIVHFKYAQFIICQLCLKKVGKCLQTAATLTIDYESKILQILQPYNCSYIY